MGANYLLFTQIIYLGMIIIQLLCNQATVKVSQVGRKIAFRFSLQIYRVIPLDGHLPQLAFLND